ncbi:4-alpha-glucanotransferase [Cutibacterium granulosum]|uniref:4-alpha-glucanotransferase n=3 Tax=Cutibacterium granulosum TaxID=33011 RepID=A0A9X5LVA1_9ACTN|nr:4-alpha-glucanotransferase [Cutibacterium granulosum]ERF66496.1 4-alpha-glucanotransferase [Cutibacterium granulosum TM11]KAG9060353.1 4-alpha-glucanotransferase [Cutibacterium granulosum DSM 20700]SNV38908.1 4-alpha-glucanotransferase [Cutibacterium granulosum]
MALSDPALGELADRFGISTQFYDWKGRHTQVGEQTVIAILAEFGVDASTPERARAVAQRVRDDHWRRIVQPCVVLRAGQEGRVDVHVPAGAPVSLRIVGEDGNDHLPWQVDNWNPDRPIDGRMIGEATFGIPGNLPLGYHELIVTIGTHDADGSEADGGIHATATSTIIVTPNRVGLPRRMGASRVWGYAAQLYSVRSHHSWGLGDLTDLADLCTWSASQGAGYLLTNPLHAAEVAGRMEPSPYLPSSRLFVNPIYIRPELIAEYHDLNQYDASIIESLRTTTLDDDPQALLDRDRTWQAKSQALELIHRVDMSASRRMAFTAFRVARGRRLEDFATWCLLSELHGSDWHDWPAELHDPHGAAVARVRREHADRIDFHMWLQWIADQQLSTVQSSGTDAGMPVGLICDLAVGVNGSGADAWMLNGLFAREMNVGAPPDPFNQAGQDWGQPPMRPDVLEQMAYAPLREMVSSALRHAGGVRIDHIMGLFRLWWVPRGLGPRHGAYVRYNHEAMVGVVALEAYRAGALVIGEDLGTVEPWVRDHLASRGILGTSIMWFETGPDGRPKQPQQWREHAMSSVTSHDLPPTSSYLRGDHVELRDRLGLLTESVDEERENARRERETWLASLRQQGVLEADEDDPEQVTLAMHTLLTRTPSKVINATLTDAVGDPRTQNLPGTEDEYPNWRVPLSGPDGEPVYLEDLYSSDRAARMAKVLRG